MSYSPSARHGKNLRIGRVSIPGQIYHVTLATRSREPVFVDFVAASMAARCLYDGALAEHAQTLAYVVMPDHLHWLLQLDGPATLPATVRAYKAKVSVLLARRVWQRGFYDHALRADEDVANTARYIVANPLRAGLCGRIGEYPFWNAVWL